MSAEIFGAPELDFDVKFTKQVVSVPNQRPMIKISLRASGYVFVEKNNDKRQRNSTIFSETSNCRSRLSH
jgi:hypothetical protein